MSAGSAAWTVLAWLFAASALGFAAAWLIQQWRIRDGRAAGRALQDELQALRHAAETLAAKPHEATGTPTAPTAAEPAPSSAMPVPPAAPDLRELQHWKGEAARLAALERSLIEERAQWQGEAMRLASAHQSLIRAAAEHEARIAAEAQRASGLQDALEAALARAEIAHSEAAASRLQLEEAGARSGETESHLAEARARCSALEAELARALEAAAASAAAAEAATQAATEAAARAATEAAARAAAEAAAQAATDAAAEAAARAASEAAAVPALDAATVAAAQEILDAAQQRVTETESQLASAQAACSALHGELAIRDRELQVLRTQAGVGSQRVLELEQEVNRLQLELLAAGRSQQASAAGLQDRIATLEAELSASREAARAAPLADAPTAAPVAPGNDDEAVRQRVAQQRMQELEEAARRGRRLTQELRAEIAGLHGRVMDLENRLAQVWEARQAEAAAPVATEGQQEPA